MSVGTNAPLETIPLETPRESTMSDNKPCSFNGVFNDIGGRRWVIFATCLMSAVWCLLQGFAQSWQTLFVFRLLLGLGIGPKRYEYRSEPPFEGGKACGLTCARFQCNYPHLRGRVRTEANKRWAGHDVAAVDSLWPLFGKCLRSCVLALTTS